MPKEKSQEANKEKKEEPVEMQTKIDQEALKFILKTYDKTLRDLKDR